MLSAENVSLNFGGVTALDDVSIDVAEGEILGLIGPNGSGKTTFFNVLTGVYPASAGRIRLAGTDITGLAPARIVRRGIARTFQNLRIYKRMTVFENVWVAQHSLPATGLGGLLVARRRVERAQRADVARLLEATGLADRADTVAGSLTLPAQRRLELARALARAPDVLLLDEPAGGMTPSETEEMSSLIREVAAPGRTCIVIEHKMDLMAGLCDRLCVLNFGRKIAEGPSAAVLRDANVIEAYLGRDEGHA